MHSVFFDFKFANDIQRAAIVRRTIVSVTVTRRLHRTSDVTELRHVRSLFLRPVESNVLNNNRRIGWSPQSLGRNLHPPHISLGRRELKRVHIGCGIEASRNIAGNRNFLRLSMQVIGLQFRHNRTCEKPLGRP